MRTAAKCQVPVPGQRLKVPNPNPYIDKNPHSAVDV